MSWKPIAAMVAVMLCGILMLGASNRVEREQAVLSHAPCHLSGIDKVVAWGSLPGDAGAASRSAKGGLEMDRPTGSGERGLLPGFRSKKGQKPCVCAGGRVEDSGLREVT